MLNSKQYDFGKHLVQIVLPATGSLYFSLGNIWGFPATEEVVGTLAVLATFLGAILKISSIQYYNSDEPYDGAIVVSTPSVGPKVFSLQLGGEPEDLEQLGQITFRVISEDLPEADPV